jgi:hypothetical protein
MTQQTAIANLKKNALYLLYNTLLKEEGGICTKSNLSLLKTKIKGVYSALFTPCANQELTCEELGKNTLSICAPIVVDCNIVINITKSITSTYSGVVPINYLFTLPLESNVTYTWSTNSPGFILDPTLNTCIARTISGIDACGQAIVINCLIQDTTYGCTLIKTLSLGITC